MVNIKNPNPLFDDNQIKKIEDHYDATFVCETCLKSSSGGWVNTAFAVFYQENPPEIAKSNYFGLYFNHDGNLMITDASSALEPFDGLMLEDGSVFYSRFRHDYRTTGGAMVDGGRDYFRYTPTAGSRVVQLQIVNDQLEIQ